MTKALTRALGLAAAIALVVTAWMALVVTPADVVQAARIYALTALHYLSAS